MRAGRRADEGGIQLARVAGVPIRVSAGLGAAAVLATIGLLVGATIDPTLFFASPPGLLLLAGSLLAHEGAHAIVAHHHGLRVERIVLRIGGGSTAYSGRSPDPLALIQIATAGPLASAALTTLFATGALLLGDSTTGRLLDVIAAVNLFLTAVNLIPAPRLDGGQIVAGIRHARRERADAR